MDCISVGSRFSAGLVGSVLIAAVVSSCSSGDDFKQQPNGTGASSGDASTGATGGFAGTTATGGGGSAGVGGSVAGAAGASGSTGGGGSSGTDGGLKPVGQTCGEQNECQSGFCVDGVCCTTACSGKCEGCSVSGKLGTCAPLPTGTDPENECGGDAASGACGGKCDGAGGCEFPGATVSCGATTCSSGQQSAPLCNGQGDCVTSSSACDPYVCGATSCIKSCNGDTECVGTAWCNAPNCETKKDPGLACAGANQCKSGYCEIGVCCNKTCAAPFTCTGGTCKCGSQECPPNDQCIWWYRDFDTDTFGDKTVKMLGCSSNQNGGWVKNDTDCLDTNFHVFPGQTQFFTVERAGAGSGYDYNCDNLWTKQYPSIAGKTCGVCKPSGPGGCLGLCSSWSGGYGCGACPSNGPASGFNGDIACGGPSTLYQCGLTASCSPLASQTLNVKQGCR